jgi:hypothetical protein
MSNTKKNETETESPAIIEEIIPGKNNDYNDKSINQKDNSSNNNQKPLIQKYNEQESAQAVSEVTDENKMSLSKVTNETGNQISSNSQAMISDTQKQMSLATRETRESYLGLQKQTTESFQSWLAPYFQNFQNQFWNNQNYFNSISELYSKLASNYIESAIAFSTIFNEVASSNMNFLRNSFNSSSINQERRMGGFEVDSGKNSDESSTNVKATFSCETCGQIFDSRQDLKEHTSLTHYR